VIDKITYVEISGPAVDALYFRKEAGGKHETTNKEIRESYQRVKPKLFVGLKQLVGAA
jgi:hypothetical protein